MAQQMMQLVNPQTGKWVRDVPGYVFKDEPRKYGNLLPRGVWENRQAGGGGAPDPMAYFAPFLAAMQEQMMAMMAMFAQPPMLPEMPEIKQAPKVDWEAKREELRAKAAAEQEKYAKNRRGLSSTVLTDLLDEEEGAEMITPILGGKTGEGIQDFFQKASSVLG